MIYNCGRVAQLEWYIVCIFENAMSSDVSFFDFRQDVHYLTKDFIKNEGTTYMYVATFLFHPAVTIRCLGHTMPVT